MSIDDMLAVVDNPDNEPVADHDSNAPCSRSESCQHVHAGPSTSDWIAQCGVSVESSRGTGRGVMFASAAGTNG